MQRRGLFPPFLRAKLFPAPALQSKSREPLLPAIIAAWPSNPTNQPSWEGIKHSHLYFSLERDFPLVSNALRRCCCRRGNCTGKLCCLDLRFSGERGEVKAHGLETILMNILPALLGSASSHHYSSWLWWWVCMQDLQSHAMLPDGVEEDVCAISYIPRGDYGLLSVARCMMVIRFSKILKH